MNISILSPTEYLFPTKLTLDLSRPPLYLTLELKYFGLLANFHQIENTIQLRKAFNYT